MSVHGWSGPNTRPGEIRIESQLRQIAWRRLDCVSRIAVDFLRLSRTQNPNQPLFPILVG